MTHQMGIYLALGFMVAAVFWIGFYGIVWVRIREPLARAWSQYRETRRKG